MGLFKSVFIRLAIVTVFYLFSNSLSSQTAYFIDGYHGGVYGHYPPWFTGFITGQLKTHPDWKINLEIEPETWDSVLVREPAALRELQSFLKDQSATGRVEFVNPSYGQSYFYNIYGESIIRHLDYGMHKIRQYFPQATFTTYSSEEPCFTSALPQILKSFGFRYASLKNPNTCWGGYIKAYGKQTVQWQGPDGSSITTVPRYHVESLQPNSTWQTIGWTNTPSYIKAALNDGITSPVAMTLQDAGWKNGPWLQSNSNGYKPTLYTTWKGYLDNTVKNNDTWKLSQEDIQVSLVWGSQVLQKIAQEVRISENKLLMAEKMAAMDHVLLHQPWPADSLREAWRTLMLAQHHDCWIVPYNKQGKATWAENVTTWTNASNQIADKLINGRLSPSSVDANSKIWYASVYNTSGTKRKDYIDLPLPEHNTSLIVTDYQGKAVPVQFTEDRIICQVEVPAYGYTTYQVKAVAQQSTVASGAAKINITKEGDLQMSNNFYTILLDKKRGGIIKSLVVKSNTRQWLDTAALWRFNELRGNFYNDGGVHSSCEQEASLSILENGPLLVKASVKGYLLKHAFEQIITMRKDDPVIDIDLTINWKSNVGIGNAYHQQSGVDLKDYQKPFYNDRDKLLAVFPVNFNHTVIYKDAPFDVTKSNLGNTFFNRWDSIKNNLMLSWVDAYDSVANSGLALFTDHTTTYAHGEDFPLALNVQYSGQGLWGRNHTINGPTHIRHAVMPHLGNWKQAKLPSIVSQWNEPLIVRMSSAKPGQLNASLVDISGTGYQLTTAIADKQDLLIRLYNAEGNNRTQQVKIAGTVRSAMYVELNGKPGNSLAIKSNNGVSYIEMAMPAFGLRTIRLKNIHP